VPRPRPNPKVTFPNGLDGNNPYLRPYGGGWRNHRYHLFERLSRSKLLVDPYAKPDKRPWNWFLKKWFNKKWSSHNYYGGRSAAQRESTRYVHRANDEVPGEAYEMDDLSTPKPNESDTSTDTTPKPFVGTAVTILQAVRKDLKVSLTKARDPAGNIYFYEKAYVPRFTKHSLRPSKRMFSIRNFLNRRLYGRPGDGANVLMAHVPIDVSIPGVDDIDRRKILAAGRGEAEPKQKEHPLGDLDWLHNFDLDAELKKQRADRKAQEKKKAKELKKSRKGERKVPDFVSRWEERREKEALARAERNYAKDVEEERKQKEKAAVSSSPPAVPSSPPAVYHDSDFVERHEAVEASREAQEVQRALEMEEACRGKKKVSFPASPVRLRQDHGPAAIDVPVPLPSADTPEMAFLSALEEHGTLTSRSIMLELEAQMAIVEKQRYERYKIRATKRVVKLGKQVRASRDAAKNADLDNTKKARHLERRQRIARGRAEQLLAAKLREEQEAMEESLDITPPRLRTPNRYRDYAFEEAEQLVTPRSPEQAHFEAIQAATPRTPSSYVLPSVEEAVDEEDERQIVDLTNGFKEFL
jgi:hypothetical protein